MNRLVALDSELHRQLRVHPGHGLTADDEVQLCPVVTAEFADLVADYPIFLAKDKETGAFDTVALLGFEDGENLFLEGGQWLAGHKPLNLQRQPFYAHPHPAGLAVLIDLASPRVGTRGEALFDGEGRTAPYLDHIRSVLGELIHGMEPTRAFIARILDLNLVEAAHLSVPFDDGERTLEGLYTVRPDALASLPDAEVVELFRSGDLERIHLMIASLTHVGALVRRREMRAANYGKTAVNG